MTAEINFNLEECEKKVLRDAIEILNNIREIGGTNVQGDIYLGTCYEIGDTDLRSIIDSLSIFLQDGQLMKI